MELNCYCKVGEISPHMLPCQECKKRFHLDCLKTGRPSRLMCDSFFKFVCETCSTTGEEQIERMQLAWNKVVILTIFNLQLEGGGKCGYFHWRDHICSFIDKNWSTFFGSKKKTNTWQGTVAGTLSAGSPNFFKSGQMDLKESGWWALITTVPEVNIDDAKPRRAFHRKLKKPLIPTFILDEPVCQGLRTRNKKNSFQSAVELKEKWSTTTESGRKTSKSKLKDSPSKTHYWSAPLYPDHVEKSLNSEKYRIIGKEDEKFITNIKSEPPDVIFSDCSNNSSEYPSIDLEVSNTNEPIAHCSNDPVYNMNCEDIGEEIEIDDSAIADFDMDVDFTSMLTSRTLETSKQTKCLTNPISILNEEFTTSIISSPSDSKSTQESQPDNKNTVSIPQASVNTAGPKIKLMNEYDEHLLLQRLEKLSDVIDKNKGACRLYRKLLVREGSRKLKRTVFDLDKEYKALSGCEKTPDEETRTKIPCKNVLDRFQVVCPSAQGRTHTSFVTRLLGFEDDLLESIISPYTMRTLKPFIFRDYESVPMRVKLLEEIIAYPYKKKGHSYTLPKWPIDYCYVKPHHIPVVNSLCREFFWPGIDLSECLQYPDFSCVVLYRKVIVGFAFMVPDVKYNEAYISFVFTHPEWRNAGIATFMIYHLIQTCMGKDVTLHVSITNPACFLYQKFGFKVEEVFLDFYNKYLPLNSKECKHALFLRLSR